MDLSMDIHIHGNPDNMAAVNSLSVALPILAKATSTSLTRLGLSARSQSTARYTACYSSHNIDSLTISCSISPSERYTSVPQLSEV